MRIFVLISGLAALTPAANVFAAGHDAAQAIAALEADYSQSFVSGDTRIAARYMAANAGRMAAGGLSGVFGKAVAAGLPALLQACHCDGEGLDSQAGRGGRLEKPQAEPDCAVLRTE